MWTLVPLGNPGQEYVATRHNLGRLLLQRWVADHGLHPPVMKEFPSGRLHGLSKSLSILLPLTYMNLSGHACAEARDAGLSVERMILIHDDKDLPLGVGRFRLTGGDGGHNGLASVFEHLGTHDIPRLRMGIGPIQRPLHDFVLGGWTDPEWDCIDRLDVPFAKVMDAIAACVELAQLPGQVNAESYWIATDE